jgi:hypothetical protein
MIKTKLLIIAAMATLGVTLGGCLMPYESDYSCDYSKGYGKCLGARDNYELSQMSDQERSKALGRQTSKSESKAEASIDCVKARQVCSCADGTSDCLFDYEKLQYLARYDCLTPSEAIALSNHESLQYLSRLVLDRRAIEHRTPNYEKKAISFTNKYEWISGDRDNADRKANQSVIADGGLNDYYKGVIESEGEGGAISSNAKPPLSCDYPSLNDGDVIRVEAYRAWLRAKPDASYPVDRGLEAKRGDQYTARGSSCGWVELSNGRYIHQSIVRVVK